MMPLLLAMTSLPSIIFLLESFDDVFRAFVLNIVLNLCHVFTISDLILFLTLIVLIIYTYYTYRLARIATVSAALLEARKDHTKDLKYFITLWRSNYFFDPYKDYDAKFHGNTSNKFKNVVISDWKYDDLVRNHLPRTSINLETLCANFSYSIDKYIELRNNLITSIMSDLAKEFESDIKKGLFVTENDGNLAVYLYSHYASVLGPDKEEYYKTGDQNLSFAYSSYMKEITFQPKLQNGLHISPRVIVRADFDLRTMHLAERLEKVLTKEYFNKYEDDILKIHSTQEDLDRVEIEIKEILDQLLRFPLLPGINCDVLKHLLSDKIK